MGTSLAVRQLKICLSKQGTQVRSLVWEDPTSRGATKAMCHNKRSRCSGEPTHHNEEQLPLPATGASSHAAVKTQHSQQQIRKIRKRKDADV